MNLKKLEVWFDGYWLGLPRSVWCMIALALGIAINLYLIRRL